MMLEMPASMSELPKPELPKNVNGYRTTHTCELCGFEPKTKNKYREKQDHLVMKHFKERIDKIFPTCRPYSCPIPTCEFTGKDKQALLRHYTGKHGILEKYLREALAEKGIHYKPGELGKRKNSTSSEGKGKNPRLSLAPPEGMTKLAEGVDGKQVTLASRPNTEELRKEVEAMMASFQPVEQPVVLPLSPSNSIITGSVGQVVTDANGIATIIQHTPPSSVITTPSPPPVGSGHTPPPQQQLVYVNGDGSATTSSSTPPLLVPTSMGMPMPNGVLSANAEPLPVSSSATPTSLPAIVLSAVAKVTAANAAANAVSAVKQPLPPFASGHMNGGTVTTSVAQMPPLSMASVSATQQLTNGMVVSNGVGLPPTISLPTNPAPIKVIDVSNAKHTPAPIANIISAAQEQQRLQEQQQQQQQVIIQQQPQQQLLQQHHLQQHQQQIQLVSENGESQILVPANSLNLAASAAPSASAQPLPIEVIAANCVNGNMGFVKADGTPFNGFIVNAAPCSDTNGVTTVIDNEDVMWSASVNGPAVVVEATDTVPVTYIETVGESNFTANTLENIEYDYLYPTTTAAAPTDVRERQLDFCML